MPTNNLKIFDENKANMLSDEEYLNSSQRLSGVQQGIASSMLQNKTLYQVSLVAYAIGQMMMNNGYDANDQNAVSTFVGNLANTIVQKVVDKATTSEAQLGTNANKFMTPATVKAAFNFLQATSDMAKQGTDTTHWMNAALVKQQDEFYDRYWSGYKIFDNYNITVSSANAIQFEASFTSYNGLNLIDSTKYLVYNTSNNYYSYGFANFNSDYYLVDISRNSNNVGMGMVNKGNFIYVFYSYQGSSRNYIGVYKINVSNKSKTSSISTLAYSTLITSDTPLIVCNGFIFFKSSKVTKLYRCAISDLDSDEFDMTSISNPSNAYYVENSNYKNVSRDTYFLAFVKDSTSSSAEVNLERINVSSSGELTLAWKVNLQTSSSGYGVFFPLNKSYWDIAIDKFLFYTTKTDIGSFCVVTIDESTGARVLVHDFTDIIPASQLMGAIKAVASNKYIYVSIGEFSFIADINTFEIVSYGSISYVGFSGTSKYSPIVTLNDEDTIGCGDISIAGTGNFIPCTIIKDFDPKLVKRT